MHEQKYLACWCMLVNGMGMVTVANKRTLFVTFMDHAKWFKVHSSQFVADFNWLIALTNCSIDVEIWGFSWWQQTDRQTNQLLYRCACVQGNNGLNNNLTDALIRTSVAMPLTHALGVNSNSLSWVLIKSSPGIFVLHNIILAKDFRLYHPCSHGRNFYPANIGKTPRKRLHRVYGNLYTGWTEYNMHII